VTTRTSSGSPPSAADISVVLLVRDDDGIPVGSGALRLLGDGVAARQRGWTTLRLETGPRQPEAVALYAGATGRSQPSAATWARRASRTRCSSSACSLLADLVVELGR
jgi:hypothetical protein